jgi:hypothetical protein
VLPVVRAACLQDCVDLLRQFLSRLVLLLVGSQ